MDLRMPNSRCECRPTEHIFVGSKAPWYEINDDLPQFEEQAG